MSESKVTMAGRIVQLEKQLEAARKFRLTLDFVGAVIIALGSFGAGAALMIAYSAGGCS